MFSPYLKKLRSGSSILPLATNVKYLNPKNYIKFILEKYNLFIFRYSPKSIYSKGFIKRNLKNIKNSDQLIKFHFDTYSDINHINKDLFSTLLNLLDKKASNIFETGSSAHGTNSSILLLSYVMKFGGEFNTVDINPQIKKRLNHLSDKNIYFHSSDSVTFINSLNKSYLSSFDIVYLDSYDLDINNPSPSEKHGLEEFLSIEKYLKKGSYVVIDDTPIDLSFFNLKNTTYDYVPGKGALVLKHIKENGGYEKIFHHYGVILKKL